MIKFSIQILAYTLSLFLINCASGNFYRYNADPEIAKEKLVLISPYYVSTVSINKNFVIERGKLERFFYINPGKYDFEVKYNNNGIYSKSTKNFSFDAKEGETVLMCGIASFDSGSEGFSSKSDWMVFPVKAKDFNPEDYKFGLGYNNTKIFKNFCISEADAKNYWSQIKTNK
jgi:hypothetical protein